MHAPPWTPAEVSRGKPGDGLKYLRDAHHRSSEDPRIRYHLAVALSRTGRESEAVAALDAILSGKGAEFDGIEAARRLRADLRR